MTFEEVKFLLDKLSSESYESFEQYSSFKLELDSSSLLLQMTIRNYVRKGIPLDGIEISYPLSIILSFYEKGEEKSEKKLETKKDKLKLEIGDNLDFI